MLVLALAALSLIAIDTQTRWLRPVHAWFDSSAAPLYWLASLPRQVGESDGLSWLTRATTAAENDQLRTEILVYKGQLQRMADITAENLRLRHLLNATQLLKDRVVVAELIGVSPNPLRHLVILNRGRADEVFVGQPVLDGDGLLGQVIEVLDGYSKALLITDSNHALPVQVVRNGIRAIAEGVGDYSRLRLRHVSPAQDIQVGDMLVSSGLGGHFPPGYPVGQVARIEPDAGQSFLEVTVMPAASMDRSRHLLLVFSQVDQWREGEAEYANP